MDDKRPDGISRRQALRTVAVGGAVLGGAAWIAPSIITTVAAQADGSGPPHTTTTEPHVTTTSVEGTTLVNNTTTTVGGNSVPGTEPPGAQVLGTQVAQGTLPFTGTNVFPTVATGLGLIAGGAAVAGIANRLMPEKKADEAESEAEAGSGIDPEHN